MTETLQTLLANRKQELLDLLHSGEISELLLAPTMQVQDAFEKNGVKYPAINYIPCFAYTDKDGRRFVEDVPQRDEAHRILRTLFEFCYIHLTIKDIV